LHLDLAHLSRHEIHSIDVRSARLIADNWGDFVNGGLPRVTEAVYEIALKAPM